ncbi:hypothetical protein DX914_10845 [Lysobacter silvisoli]|uniref:Uncharacterized protein n=2 Tax=Lysobacter silvisoli TaxID=2293254 RepID=A0A371K6G0_9GAMM|nr:hypothetical protein DX914_10845 [Lysobacter silvisoli]
MCLCRRCDFSFSSDHQHGSYRSDPPMGGYCYALCVQCLSEFMLPTAGPRGPHDGERMELCRVELDRERVTLQGTGVHLEFYEVATGAWSDRFTLATTACPECRSQGTLKVEFAPGDPCPRCKQAKLI